MTMLPRDDEDELIDASVEWLSALLDSARVANIGVANWWPRARSALETAAASADTYSHAVSVACRKLQVDNIPTTVATKLFGPGSVEDLISQRFDEWRLLAQRDAISITALTQIARAEKRTRSGKPVGVDIDPEGEHQ